MDEVTKEKKEKKPIQQEASERLLNGKATINQIRKEMGFPKLDMPEANMRFTAK